MSKKRKLKKPTLAESKSAIWFGLFMLLGLIAIVYAASRLRLSSTPSDSHQVPVYFQRAEDAMPFPNTLDPARFDNPYIRRAYQVAKDDPAVLAQQPCYCYCQREGHRSLLDCFATKHGATCGTCVKEAVLAGQMHQQGKSAAEIRAAIIQGQWKNVGNSQ